MEFKHYSVMLGETIDMLGVKPDGIYLDGTLGGAGHSSEICKRLTTGHLYGVDRDEAAIEAASERLKPFSGKYTILRSNYSDALAVLSEMGVTSFDGILLDLGVSSYQLDTGERGFSYRFDAPLDMRMDTRQELTAADIVNEYSESELYRIIRDYGEEKFAKNIAKHIAAARKDKRIETTSQLDEIIHAAIPAKMRTEGHPAKQTFQALRIECNQELKALEKSLDEMTEALKSGGRFCVITFHSLEDRMVKASFRKSESPCTCPPNFPVCVCGKKPLGRVITKKPITASEKELKENSRSKSAKLRVFERV